MLIAMTGKKRSGKDTVASMIAEETGYERIAFAGTLKGMIKFLLMSSGMSAEEAERRVNGSEAEKEEPLVVLQDKSTRHAMQTLGTEWRDTIGKDLWTDIVKAKVQSTEGVIITDMRFPHEATFVDDHGGVKVRVVRPGTTSTDPHPSEVLMDQIEVDFTIYNHGSMDQLDEAAFRLLQAATRMRGLI
ncbi:hypothetical protein KEU06_08765 [Pseudaminobacter sp. 19-2017]|uniref:Deoxynucleotide monophosphate kinase n=1 Tax=Pseudaminobacter soli (ex Zhang et al. 2022) TaxID=2831468 RepID=A0A942DWL8_9HYPH|nr:hypothetical protein [Pseudaminobacter soli]MBS3648719.1 hypothetical protein [Pseudaminobacter soli]